MRTSRLRPSNIRVGIWDRNATITTRLVDAVTTPMLMKAVQSGRLQPGKLVTHRVALHDILKAYETFGDAATHAPSRCLSRRLRDDEIRSSDHMPLSGQLPPVQGGRLVRLNPQNC